MNIKLTALEPFSIIGKLVSLERYLDLAHLGELI